MSLQRNRQTRFKARVFDALSDAMRLEILEFLRLGEKCVCEIVPQIEAPQPVVSRHLRILREAGLVRDRKDGTKRLYSVTELEIFKMIDSATPSLLSRLSEHVTEQIVS